MHQQRFYNETKKKGPAPKLFKNEACRICGERAEGVNYNAISCMACKAFYRRVVVAGRPLTCIFPIIETTVPFDERRTRCRHCRLEACHMAGMKPEYVTLEKKSSLKNFSGTLNPQQENILNICQSFWTFYLHGTRELPTSGNRATNFNSLAYHQTRQRQLNINITPWDNDNDFSSPFNRIEHLKGIMLLHCETIKCIFDLIPGCRKFSQSLRDLIIIHTGSQLPVLRAANLCYFNEDVGWRGLNGKIYNRHKLEEMGLPKNIVNTMFEIMQKIVAVNPNQTEMALLGVLCLLSPGTLKHMISYTEQRDVENIQEAIFNILRTKLKLESKPSDNQGLKRLASFVSIMSDLKSFHSNNMRTWEKFLTFKPKIVPNLPQQNKPSVIEEVMQHAIRRGEHYN